MDHMKLFTHTLNILLYNKMLVVLANLRFLDISQSVEILHKLQNAGYLGLNSQLQGIIYSKTLLFQSSRKFDPQ